MKRLIPCLWLMVLLISFQTMPLNAQTLNIRAPQGVVYEGGDGSGFAKAVIVKAPNEDLGVKAEYQWLAQKYPGYNLGQQSSAEHEGKTYDLMEITTAQGEKKTVYFDITDFYGKF